METVELVMEIEEEFQIQLPNEQCARVRTVGDLVALVRERLRVVTAPDPKQASLEPSEDATRGAGFPQRVWTDAELFLRIQELVAEVAGVELTRVRPESHLVYDLGLD